MVYRALCRVLRRGGDGGVCWKWRKHTSSTCVWKASISSQRLRMRSSSLGKSIDIVAGVGEEDRHGRGEYFVPCIGPRLTQAVRGARRGAAFAPSVPLTTVHRPLPPPSSPPSPCLLQHVRQAFKLLLPLLAPAFACAVVSSCARWAHSHFL
jgi:hypothetical protein